MVQTAIAFRFCRGGQVSSSLPHALCFGRAQDQRWMFDEGRSLVAFVWISCD